MEKFNVELTRKDLEMLAIGLFARKRELVAIENEMSEEIKKNSPDQIKDMISQREYNVILLNKIKNYLDQKNE